MRWKYFGNWYTCGSSDHHYDGIFRMTAAAKHDPEVVRIIDMDLGSMSPHRDPDIEGYTHYAASREFQLYLDRQDLLLDIARKHPEYLLKDVVVVTMQQYLASDT